MAIESDAPTKVVCPRHPMREVVVVTEYGAYCGTCALPGEFWRLEAPFHVGHDVQPSSVIADFCVTCDRQIGFLGGLRAQ